MVAMASTTRDMCVPSCIIGKERGLRYASQIKMKTATCHRGIPRRKERLKDPCHTGQRLFLTDHLGERGTGVKD